MRFCTLNVFLNALWSTWSSSDIVSVGLAEVEPVEHYCVNVQVLTVKGSYHSHVVVHWIFLASISCAHRLTKLTCAWIILTFFPFQTSTIIVHNCSPYAVCPLPGSTPVDTKMWTTPHCSDFDIFMCVRCTVIICNFSGPLIYWTAFVAWIIFLFFSELSWVGMGKYFEVSDCIWHSVSVTTQCYWGLKNM